MGGVGVAEQERRKTIREVTIGGFLSQKHVETKARLSEKGELAEINNTSAAILGKHINRKTLSNRERVAPKR
jgi:hypothetical protein